MVLGCAECNNVEAALMKKKRGKSSFVPSHLISGFFLIGKKEMMKMFDFPRCFFPRQGKYMQVNTHTHTLTHAHAHARTHTHTHTHKKTKSVSQS